MQYDGICDIIEKHIIMGDYKCNTTYYINMSLQIISFNVHPPESCYHKLEHQRCWCLGATNFSVS